MNSVILFQPFTHLIGHFSAEMLGICHAAKAWPDIDLTVVTTHGIPDIHYNMFHQLGIKLVPDKAIQSEKLTYRKPNRTPSGLLSNTWNLTILPLRSLLTLKKLLNQKESQRIVVLDITFPSTYFFWKIVKPDNATFFFRGGSQSSLSRDFVLLDLLPPFDRITLSGRLKWFYQPCNIMTECPETLDDLRFVNNKKIRARLLSGWTPHLPFRKKVERTNACKQLDLPIDKKYLLLPYVVRANKGAIDLLRIAHEFDKLGAVLILAGQIEKDVKKYISDNPITSTLVHIDDRFVSEDIMDLYFSVADAVAIMHPYGSGTFIGALDYEVPIICKSAGKVTREVKSYFLGEVADDSSDGSGLLAAFKRIIEWNNHEQQLFLDGCRQFKRERSPEQWLQKAI